MAGEICLVGGNEYRSGCVEMDKAIIQATGKESPRVLIVPTAAVTGPVKSANDGVTYFSSLGAHASPLMVLERQEADDPGLAKEVASADIVYFSGGNPDHLLATLRGSRLLDELLEAVSKGTVLAGSSAGAMVLGSWMRRPSGGTWVEALGVVPGVAVLPHHEGRRPEDVSTQLQGQLPTNLKVLGIDAMVGCMIGPSGWRVAGSGNVTVYADGAWKVHGPGEAIPSA